jgi:hypothetical protein
MGLMHGIEGLDGAGRELSSRAAVSYEEQRRASRSTRLGVGTLACGRCDAPVAIGPSPLALTDELSCPFCDARGPVRDFLSLARPARPARVVIRVGPLR